MIHIVSRAAIDSFPVGSWLLLFLRATCAAKDSLDELGISLNLLLSLRTQLDMLLLVGLLIKMTRAIDDKARLSSFAPLVNRHVRWGIPERWIFLFW